jgi:hypothetical protein
LRRAGVCGGQAFAACVHMLSLGGDRIVVSIALADGQPAGDQAAKHALPWPEEFSVNGKGRLRPNTHSFGDDIFEPVQVALWRVAGG